MSVIQADKVTMMFGGLKALSDINLHIDEGEIVALIGPNGAGKTTFFNLLTGIYKATEGAMTFNGTDLGGLKPHEICSLGHRPHVPEHPPVREHDHARERHGRAPFAFDGRTVPSGAAQQELPDRRSADRR